MDPLTHTDLSDIRKGDWIDRHLPPSWEPYARLARLDRPVGTGLALFPCLAALVQATHQAPGIDRLVVFSLGAFLMRSAGCTINDMADRTFDRHVERTRWRPLASGALGLHQALVFLIAQLALAASLLVFLSPYTRIVAICVVPGVVLYPFCKRFTYWPQAVLGAAFNWGMLMAWSEVAGYIPAGALLMWLGAITWQIGYDTAYAYVDRQDDIRLGLKSTAILFGENGRMIVAAFYVLTVMAWSIGGWVVGMSPLYFIGLAAIAAHFAWQVLAIDFSRPFVNFRLFRANISIGGLLLLAAFAGTW